MCEAYVKNRIQKFRHHLEEDRMEAFVVTDPANVYYLSGFRGRDGALFVTLDHVMLLVDDRYVLQAHQEASHLQIASYEEEVQGISEAIASSKASRVGFEPRLLPVETFTRLQKACPHVRWIVPSQWHVALRAKKEQREIALLSAAIAVANKSFKEVVSGVSEGREEREIAIELEYQMKKRAAESVSFPILVASGGRSAWCHAIPTGRKLTRGDVGYVDFGCVLGGYHTDQTISFCVGNIREPWITIHRILRDAHDRVIETLQAGQMAKDVDRVARDAIERTGYGKNFVHGLGHGVGLEAHEFPTLCQRVDTRLEVGMVVTVEPGIYLLGEGGMRLESMVLVSESGGELLTTMDKDLLKL